MSHEINKKCLIRLKLNGESHISIYPKQKIVFIDNLPTRSERRSFFCDFKGNIICPFQMNNVLKNSDSLPSYSTFFGTTIALLFFTCDIMNLDTIEPGTYFNLKESGKPCYLKVIFSQGSFCLGAIGKKPDRELSECLKLLPADLSNWNRMILKDDSFRVVSE
ncbi:MAG: hypothetical protein K9N06_01325 [Candidatus Cloacimonetes bacterium]|nr:hypothetical protein [Candidatus Cloacimonadota bacterium]